LVIVVAIFAALKWEVPALSQGKEEGCGFGFGKNSNSRFIRSISQELAFHIIPASIVTLWLLFFD
jgi:hypothetical protein